MFAEKWNDIRAERDCVDTIPLGGYDDPTNSNQCGSSTLGKMRVESARTYYALKEA
jgi:hypothetical protein